MFTFLQKNLFVRDPGQSLFLIQKLPDQSSSKENLNLIVLNLDI